MTFDPDAPRFALGLIHDHQPSLVPDLALFATAPLPAPAPSVQVPAVSDWQMACNDRLGCCVMSEVVHDDMAWSAITGEPYTYPGDEAVQKAYFALTGGSDTGLIIDTMLQSWHRHGVGCSPNKIGPWAPVNPHNTTALKQCIDFFGVCRIGVNLPAIAQQQFGNHEAWDLTGTEADADIEGGHDVGLYGYDSVFYAVTWGQVQPVTLRWLQRYTTTARAVIPHEFVERGGDARGIDIARIDQFVTKLAA